MKKIQQILLIAFLVLGVNWGIFAQTHQIKLKNRQELQDFFKWRKDRLPLVSGHRGGEEDNFPENSIETFENTIRSAPAIIECDIALTKDQELVMMHDNKIDRTTNGSGNVSDFTLAELQQFYLKDGQGNLTNFKIPTLKQVLEWAKGKVILTLDIKKGVPAQRIVDAVKEHQAESYALVITYNLKSALEYHQLYPELLQSVNITSLEDLKELQKSPIPLNQVIAFTGVTKVNSQVIKALHKKKIFAMLGTMNQLDKEARQNEGKTYPNLVEQGVDMFATDQPKLAFKSLEKYWKKSSSKRKYFFYN